MQEFSENHSKFSVDVIGGFWYVFKLAMQYLSQLSMSRDDDSFIALMRGKCSATQRNPGTRTN